MSDIAILKEIIRQRSIVPLQPHYDDRQKVVLQESSGNSYSIPLYGMPDQDQVIVIKADDFTAPKDIFANSKHECKRADFVIIAELETQTIAVCIELKAGKGDSESSIIQQLKGTKCFVAYCREIGQCFWEQPNFLKDISYRFVSIKNISISKKPSRPSGRIETPDRPEKMLKLSSPTRLQFRQLIGKL